VQATQAAKFINEKFSKIIFSGGNPDFRFGELEICPKIYRELQNKTTFALGSNLHRSLRHE
jgi:hypothetical protein